MTNITVFASHGGSDMQAIIDGCKSGAINGRVVAVISNNADSYALVRAQKEGIDRYHIAQSKYPDEESMVKAIHEVLDSHNTDMVFLAGYLKKIDPSIIKKYENNIYNIHPALLPKYGGKGMHGINVHTAVINAGDKETGITIHRVTEEYDSGTIIAQAKVPVLENDTPEILAARVLEREHTFLVEVLERITK
ncbi:MAG: phosphoribosylglycinamide formyltransferase [Clostridia bacterium]|nr:phosphoribosylglycinamide formyltransferase [Clostridia bacterium]